MSAPPLAHLLPSLPFLSLLRISPLIPQKSRHLPAKFPVLPHLLPSSHNKVSLAISRLQLCISPRCWGREGGSSWGNLTDSGTEPLSYNLSIAQKHHRSLKKRFRSLKKFKSVSERLTPVSKNSRQCQKITSGSERKSHACLNKLT